MDGIDVCKLVTGLCGGSEVLPPDAFLCGRSGVDCSNCCSIVPHSSPVAVPSWSRSMRVRRGQCKSVEVSASPSRSVQVRRASRRSVVRSANPAKVDIVCRYPCRQSGLCAALVCRYACRSRSGPAEAARDISSLRSIERCLCLLRWLRMVAKVPRYPRQLRGGC